MTPGRKRDLKFSRHRKELVDVLRKKGITNQPVLDAILHMPRHAFIPDSALHSMHAYEDKAFPIGEGQTISQPYTVAFQTQLLDVKPNEKVLEIGTGSGYQAAILAEMNANVYTIERHKALYERTKKQLFQLGYSDIKTYYGDGYKGKPAFAPYDKIIVTAAAPYIPKALVDQLKKGGVLVIPVDNEDGIQDMMRVFKKKDGTLKKEIHNQFAFVPMLKGKA